MTVHDNIEVPKWDVALANLAREEHRKKGAPLTLADFQRLARDYAIRLDDIMITMFELVIQGQWSYVDAGGATQAIVRKTLDDLYINGRLHFDDLKAFDGGWSPLG